MNFRKRTLQAALLVTCTIGFSGCATMDSAYTGTIRLTNPDAVTLSGDVDWVNPQPSLRLSDDMSVFVRVRNSSGSDFATRELKSKLEAALSDAGYTVSKSPKRAQYLLRMNVRAYGENASKEVTSGAGAAIGGVAGYTLSSNNQRKGTAAVGGAILGEVATNILRNRNKNVRIELVSDLILGERIEGGVTTSIGTGGQDSLSTQANGNAMLSNNYGSNKRGSTTSQNVEIKETFLKHENRLVAYAEKVKLTPEEAKAFLIDKMALAVGGALP